METENQVMTTTEIAEETKDENSAFIDFKMVTFSLAGKDYSIDIMNVKEIAKAGRFTYVPNTMPFVLGVYNLRGEIIPILDLRLFFNIEVPKRTDDRLENMLILSVEDQKFGVVVDKIDKVVGVQKSSIQPPHPLFGDINVKYIDGVVEANKRLYVLLDVTRIFASKDSVEGDGAKAALQYKRAPQIAPKPKASAIPQKSANIDEGKKTPLNEAQNKTETKQNQSSEPEVDDKLFGFIKDSLLNFKKFSVSQVNESWIAHRVQEWKKLKGDKAQITTETEAEEFLKPFWSTATNQWWTKQFAESVEKVLPDNSAKQIMVWNPGCGKGTETYSLACVLQKRYPGAKIRIYAQDIDLLTVSNAAMMSIPDELANDWYGPYLTKKANGEYTFNQEIKESIMFEYHDCKNTNALPMVDIVFARDILSLIDAASQEAVVADFVEKMKGNAVAIIGENESMPASFNFGEKSIGSLVAYNKD